MALRNKTIFTCSCASLRKRGLITLPAGRSYFVRARRANRSWAKCMWSSGARWPTLFRSKSCHYQACVAFFHEDEDRSEHGGLQGSLLCDSGMDRFNAHEDVLFGGLRMIQECVNGKEELNTVYSLNSKSPFERRNAHDVVHTRFQAMSHRAEHDPIVFQWEQIHQSRRSAIALGVQDFCFAGSHPSVHSVGDSGRCDDGVDRAGCSDASS